MKPVCWLSVKCVGVHSILTYSPYVSQYTPFVCVHQTMLKHELQRYSAHFRSFSSNWAARKHFFGRLFVFDYFLHPTNHFNFPFLLSLASSFGQISCFFYKLFFWPFSELLATLCTSIVCNMRLFGFSFTNI